MRRASLALALGLLTCILGPLAQAHAGAFTVWACATAAGKPLPAGDWAGDTIGAAAAATTTCGITAAGGIAGNLQAVTGGGPDQADRSISAQWSVAAAPGTKINALDVWWMNQAGVQMPGLIEVYGGTTSLYTRATGTFGSATLPFDEVNHQSFPSLAAPSATLVAWCLVGCARPDRAISALFQAYRLKVTVSDDVAPTGEASGVTDGMTIGAPLTLQARATDVGGGVRDLQLLVDGNVVDAKQAGGQCEDIDSTTGDVRDYAIMRPCVAQLPAAGQPLAHFSLTPAMLSPGTPHTVAIVAHDAAGNAGTLLSSRVTVAPALQDGPPPPTFFDSSRDLFFNPDADTTGPPQPNGANAGPANITLSFVQRRLVGRRGHRRIVPRFTRGRIVSYTARAQMRGLVRTSTGEPISGARVYRAISVDGGSWRLEPKPLVTTNTGAVTFALPARSPNRRVQLVYFPFSDSNTSSRSPMRLLRVRAPVSLQLGRRWMPRGASVGVVGRVRAGIRPGATVRGTLQMEVRRGAWRTLRQLRFTRRGHGRARTALRLRTPGVYRLRLHVPTQRGLRYSTGTSRPRTLRVT